MRDTVLYTAYTIVLSTLYTMEGGLSTRAAAVIPPLVAAAISRVLPVLPSTTKDRRRK